MIAGADSEQHHFHNTMSIEIGARMISMHTHKSVALRDLELRGELSHIGGGQYRLDIGANSATGAGPVSSYWTPEPGEAFSPAEVPCGAQAQEI